MTQLRRKLHIFGIGCLIVSLSMNAVFFLGFGSGNFKVRKTVSTEPLRLLMGSEIESELVFDRFAVATEKNTKTTPDFVISDTRFEDMLFMGQSKEEGQQYEITLNIGKELSQAFVLTTTNPPDVQEAWYTYDRYKTKRDLNVDGTADILLNIEGGSVHIKIDKKWVPVKLDCGSEYQRQTIHGKTYRFEDSTGKWVPDSSKKSETE